MPHSAKQLATLADKFYTMREKRRAEQKKVDAMKEAEVAVWSELKDGLIEAKTNAIAGKVCHAEVVNKQKPVIKDLVKFRKYIVKNDAWDLLPRSVVASAAKERWESGEAISGIDSESYVDLSVGKV